MDVAPSIAVFEVQCGGAVVRVGPGYRTGGAGDEVRGEVGSGDAIASPSGVLVLTATQPVDFRMGTGGLAELAKVVLKQGLFCGWFWSFGPSAPVGSSSSHGTARHVDVLEAP